MSSPRDITSVLLWVMAAGPCCAAAPPGGPTRAEQVPAYVPFLERRAAHQTELTHDAPSPNRWKRFSAPEGVREVRYRSGELELMAWFAVPPRDKGERVPALLYFHGDFSFHRYDFELCRPFLEAGFAVMTPTLRGENGNPGRFELLYGEVDDGAAAVRWLAAQPEIDPARIYTFGHSAGGAISVMMALFPDLPIRETASVGGIYVPETFLRWSQMRANSKLVRFDPRDRNEIELRVPGPNVRDLAHPHIAYIGDDDPWFIRNASAVADAADELDKPFLVERVPGDHASSRKPAFRAFLERIASES